MRNEMLGKMLRAISDARFMGTDIPTFEEMKKSGKTGLFHLFGRKKT